MADTVVFLDTSIQIARMLREQEMRARIVAWTARYRLKVTGSIAVHEFRNRVLRDTAYLLTKLNKFNSYQRTLDHVTNVLPRQMERRRRICLPILHRLIFGASDAELTERARRYCRSLLIYGEARFLQGVDSTGPGIGCYLAQVPVREKRRYERYEFPDQRCSKSLGQCTLPRSLEGKIELCGRLLQFLDGLPPARLTGELNRARTFLRLVVSGEPPERLFREDPCLQVGDLLLAVESERVSDVYTMNYSESQAYCDILGQDLTVRPNNPEAAERHYRQAEKPWPLP